MIERLFRGKRVDTKEWVFGYHVCVGEEYHYILTGKLDITKCIPTFEHYLVDPATVGQYICRTDRNEKKIFEGDIAILTYGGETRYCEVKYIERLAKFVLDYGRIGKSSFDDLLNGVTLEIVGNIHDSYELLD